jgi:hypothetical protein
VTKKVVKPPDDDEATREDEEPDEDETPDPDEPSSDAAEDTIEEVDLDKLIEEKVEAKLKGSGPAATSGDTESSISGESDDEGGAVTHTPERDAGPDDLDAKVNAILEKREAEKSLAQRVEEIDARTKPKPRPKRGLLATMLLGPRED